MSKTMPTQDLHAYLKLIFPPREALVTLSLIMLTSSTIATSLNIPTKSSSVICFGTCPTNSLTLSPSSSTFLPSSRLSPSVPTSPFDLTTSPLSSSVIASSLSLSLPLPSISFLFFFVRPLSEWAGMDWNGLRYNIKN